MEEQLLLIGLSGKMGSGKDTVAGMLCEFFPGMACRAFATRIKEVVAAQTHTTLEQNMSQEGKALVPRGFDESLGVFQQKIGEGQRKVLGSDIWIRCALENEPLPQMAVVTDCRRKDEARAIEARGGVLLRLEGDPAGVRRENRANRDLEHITETDLDDWPFEHVIQNDGTLAELRLRLADVITPLFRRLGCHGRLFDLKERIGRARSWELDTVLGPFCSASTGIPRINFSSDGGVHWPDLARGDAKSLRGKAERQSPVPVVADEFQFFHPTTLRTQASFFDEEVD